VHAQETKPLAHNDFNTRTLRRAETVSPGSVLDGGFRSVKRYFPGYRKPGAIAHRVLPPAAEGHLSLHYALCWVASRNGSLSRLIPGDVRVPPSHWFRFDIFQTLNIAKTNLNSHNTTKRSIFVHRV